MNLAVRKSINENQNFAEMLGDLSRFAATSRRSTKIAEINSSLKSKLRCENATRWSSSYLMLITFLTCFNNGTFSDDYFPPFSRSVIETYVQILKPCYLFSVLVQRSLCTIGEVVPLLYLTILNTERLDLENEDLNEAKLYRNELVELIKIRFNYELLSKAYKVAALFKISKLNVWYNRSFAKLVLTNCKENIKEVYNLFMKPGEESSPTIISDISDPNISDSELEPMQCRDLFKKFGKFYF